jgi:dTDP-4-amino-4,6-dideoxygalactose transaminase
MSDNQNIPFLDLVGLHQELEKELVPIFQKALRTAGFIGGPMVEGFEVDFARFCDAARCVGVASGTDAVRFALMAAGVEPGDIVVTVERTYCMDPAKLQKYLEQECYLDRETGKPFHRTLKAPVTAVIPVHIYGQTADMDRILELARRYRLIVIEDACQAHGAEYFSKKENRWRKAGSMGHAGAFSFYPGKNLGACGEAGAVTTNDEALAQQVRLLRDHGQARKYYHELEGYNGRLDAIQAGILQSKLHHLGEWNQKRREAAAIYNELLGDAWTKLVLPFEPSWSRSVDHLYVVRTARRNDLQEHLTKAGIGTGIHYPVPVHLQKPYRALGYKEGDFPVAEKAAAQVLSLPMYPGLDQTQQKRVVEEIRRFGQVGENRLPVQPAVSA